MVNDKRDEIMLQMFDGTNYDKWKFRLNLFLELKECNEVLTNDEKPEKVTEGEWKVKDLKAKNYIVNSMTNTQLELIISEKTAKNMIKKLDDTYLVKSSATKLLIKRKLLDLKLKENENPVDFFDIFEKQINELRNAGENVSNEDKINYLLLALPEKLSHIVDIVDALPSKEKTVEYIKSKLLLEYKKKESNFDLSSVKNSLQAFSSDKYNLRKTNQSYFKNNKSNTQPENILSRPNPNYTKSMDSRNYSKRCFICNKIGHISRNCWSNIRFSQQRNSKQNTYVNSNKSARISNNNIIENKENSNSFHTEILEIRKTEEPKEINLATKQEEIKWLLDSGCSDHIINTDKYFSVSRNLENPVNIKVGDGFSLKSYTIGDIVTYFDVNGEMNKVTIKNIYYVPNMKQNLLSVSCIVKENNLVTFDKDSAKIYNSSGSLISVAVRKGKLFEMNGKVLFEENEEVKLFSTNKGMTNKEKWHRILGHTNFNCLNELCRLQLLNGLPTHLENEPMQCEVCLTNKMTNLPFENKRRRASDLLEIIHTDVNGPITQTGYKGEKYFVTFIDDYSRIAIVYCIKNKSDVYDRFVEYINLVHNQTGKRIKEIRCDNGKEYLNRQFFELAKQKGIFLKPAPAYTHELNGVAERYNRTIMDRARCLLLEAKLEKCYWPECIYTAAYLGNRLLTNTQEKKTPYEIFFKIRPDISNLHIYGSIAFIRIPEERRSSKLNPKSMKGKLVGYTDTGYKILVDDKVLVSRHVKFVENTTKFLSLDLEDEEIIQTKVDEKQQTKVDEKQKDEDDYVEEVKIQTRSKREKKLPKKFDDHIVYANLSNYLVPESYSEAIHSEDSKKWLQAMNKEISSLEENQTWKIVNQPLNKKIVEVKWIYRIKSDKTYKARVVAKGFQQDFVENEEIYSPVARMTTLKVLLSVSCVNSWKIEQMDVETAFLNGKIKSEVYIYPPDGYEIDPNKVCLLQKSLYGLRESPRDWYECFNDFMNNANFKRSNYDYCLYSGLIYESKIYLLLYVDDLLICGENERAISKLKLMLSERFHMKDLGKVNQYLGINIEYDANKKEMYLSQENYITGLAMKYELEESRIVETPMEINLKLEPADKIDDKIKYRNLIGTLLYIANGTRPDISFSVNYLSRFQQSYCETHYRYALRVLKYLYHTRSLKLNYNTRIMEKLDAFVDSDWASDTLDRKSTTGIIVRIFGNLVLWKTQKQRVVSRASTHAEFYALADCVQEVIPIKGILSEFGIKKEDSVNIYEDNSGAIALSKHGKFSKNSKHIDTSYHFVNDYEKKGIINVQKISTQDQLADILTKSLGKTMFKKFRALLGIY